MDELFVYKYRPNKLNEIKFQPSVKLLKNMVNKKKMMNCIFYGLKGSGKKTILYAFLNDKYGQFYTKYIEKIYKINSTEIMFPYFYSPYHIEIDVSNMKSYSKIILSKLIKENSKFKNLTNMYKIIVIHNADKLDVVSQNMLRRIMEKYYENCRFIFLTKRINKIIEPLKSRNVLINIKNLELNEIKQITDEIIKNENSNVTYEPKSRNIKHELFNLENKIKNYNFNFLTYEQKLLEILNLEKITKESYEKINDFLYDLLVKNISPNDIYEYVLNYYVKQNKNINNIINLVKNCEEKHSFSLRPFLHIQHFFYSLLNN